MSLHDQWRLDVALLAPSPDDESARQCLEDLLTRHGEPHRKYHGLSHLTALFKLMEAHAPFGLSNPLCQMAVWFHDAVYDPQSPTNEAQSADLAVEWMRRFGQPDAFCDALHALILATRNHWDAPKLGDGDYFLDADIAILGADTGIYSTYTQNVRAEYAAIPEDLFRLGRRQFLEGALKRERLFRTAPFHAAFEDQARANLHAELDRL